jgi:peptidoglycan/LPS O-acetylase OafA/YrhL
MEPGFLKNREGLKVVTVGLLLLFLVSLGSSALKITEWRISLIAIISLILVYIGSFNQNYIIPSNSVLKAILIWTGARSYAIYLIHIPSFFFSRELCLRIVENNAAYQGYYQSMVVAIGLSLVILASELNYRFLETPLRDKGAKVARAIGGRAKTVNST